MTTATAEQSAPAGLPKAGPAPARIYDCLFLFDAAKLAGDSSSAIAQIHAVLEKHHAKIVASRPWDERKLAYPIGNTKKGLYYLIYLEASPASLPPIEQDLALIEAIQRYLIIHIPHQWVEPMMAIAKDERALALQAAHDDSLDGALSRGEGDGDGDAPPRGGRGRRGGDEDLR